MADQRDGGRPENVFVLAEFADPGWRGRRVVEVCVFLLHAPFAGCVGVQFGGAAAGFRGRGAGVGVVGLGAFWMGLAGLGGVVGMMLLLLLGAVHVWARLRAVRGYHWGVGTNWGASAGRRLRVGRGIGSVGRIGTRRLRISVLLARPDHLGGRVGAAGEGELRLVGGRLGGFLVQEAHVLVAGGRGRCLRVGNGGRDDAALVGRSYKQKDGGLAHGLDWIGDNLRLAGFLPR